MKPSRSNPRGRTIARPAPIAIACLPSPDELLASAFLSAKSGDDRKALGRAIILQEARRRDCQFVKVTTEGEVFFHGHSGARSGRRFYLAGKNAPRSGHALRALRIGRWSSGRAFKRLFFTLRQPLAIYRVGKLLINL